MPIFANDSDENTRVQIAARCDADGGQPTVNRPSSRMPQLDMMLIISFQ